MGTRKREGVNPGGLTPAHSECFKTMVTVPGTQFQDLLFFPRFKKNFFAEFYGSLHSREEVKLTEAKPLFPACRAGKGWGCHLNPGPSP
jgi:hypothetical protein